MNINNVLDPCISNDVKNNNDFDHSYQTRQLTELINVSNDRGSCQKQYLIWFLVATIASGSLRNLFVNKSSICVTIMTSGGQTKHLRKLINGLGGRYLCLLQYLFWLLVPKTASGSLKAIL